MTHDHLSVKQEIQSRAELRRALLQTRLAIAPETRALWNASLVQNLLRYLDTQTIQCLGIYSPIQGEPDISAALGTILEKGISLALPVVLGKNLPLAFYDWNFQTPMENDRFGIPIPATREQAVQADAFLIPCVGFNQAHFRLGYGGGFYDRTLAAAPDTVAIGIAYQLSQCHFAIEKHDQAMRHIITE